MEGALQRGTRAGLLVLVAPWLRAAAGRAGLRETFRRALWRLRWVPPAREASEILDGLDSGGRLIASGRTLIDTLGPVEKRPLPVAAVVRDWVAAEAAGFRAGVAAARARLSAAPRDGVLVALAFAPALTLLGLGERGPSSLAVAATDAAAPPRHARAPASPRPGPRPP